MPFKNKSARLGGIRIPAEPLPPKQTSPSPSTAQTQNQCAFCCCSIVPTLTVAAGICCSFSAPAGGSGPCGRCNAQPCTGPCHRLASPTAAGRNPPAVCRSRERCSQPGGSWRLPTSRSLSRAGTSAPVGQLCGFMRL